MWAGPKQVCPAVPLRRILGRLQGNDVTVLAHPGLVLRRVDATLVREVLADACGLGQVSDSVGRRIARHAEKQTWLVLVNTGYDVVHRRDVRGLMLEQMLGEHPRAGKIGSWSLKRHRTAVGSKPSRASVSRHCTMLLPAIHSRGEQGLRALADHRAHVEDLPLRIRALTKDAAGGRRLSQMELDALPVENRRRILGRRRRRLVSEGLESAVRRLRPQRRWRSNHGISSEQLRSRVSFHTKSKAASHRLGKGSVR